MDYDRLRELQEKFEENPRRYFAPLANEYRKGGQPKRAIEICRAQLEQMPSHMSGQIVYGQSLYEAGEFDEARQVFQRALTLDPENLIALRTLGDMALQRGDSGDARSWYTRLLDADPKDTAVIALVSEIDASQEALTPVPEEIPGIDTDAGDQAIPFITDSAGEPVSEGATPMLFEAASSPAGEAPREGDTAEAPAAEESAAPPVGLERHYPVEHVEAPASLEADDSPDVVEPRPRRESAEAPPATASIEDVAPAEAMGAEGLESKIARTEPIGAEGLQPQREPEPISIEGVRGTEPADAVPEGTEGLKGTPPPAPLAGATGSRSDDEQALDTWTPPPAAPVHERKEPHKEDRMFSGGAPEPFVNETMAQLYLQQGYRQLALRVYYQLAEARPNDQALKDRIAQIEAEDRAAHPDTPVARREPPPVEMPLPEPIPARSPSIETPTPDRAPESEETPSFDRTPVDSPPSSRPSRERESIEAPTRDERAEPEGIAARQPSIKEFFATLGRRRPPRGMASAAPPAPSRVGAPAPPSAPPARNMSAAPIEPAAPIGGAAASATLDAVFAGATVNPADSRAASRLAGAFSGTVGATRTTPPTPPMPTPRVNPRLPASQESEEDVAKFRAWLDGLTGE